MLKFYCFSIRLCWISDKSRFYRPPNIHPSSPAKKARNLPQTILIFMHPQIYILQALLKRQENLRQTILIFMDPQIYILQALLKRQENLPQTNLVFMDPQNIHPRNLAEKAGHLFRMSQNCKFWYLTCCDNSVYISPLEDEIYLICKAVLPFVRSALCSASALCMYLISRSTLCFRPEDVCVIRLNRYQ